MPPSLPLWMVAVSTIFGVVIGKEIFGGTGYNVFNPALVARVFTFFAYPTAMSGDVVWVWKMPQSDGLTAATSLLASAKESLQSITEDIDYSFFNFISGSLHNNFVDYIYFKNLFYIFFYSFFICFFMNFKHTFILFR